MPVVLKIDSRRRVVYSSFYGRVTDKELLGHRSTIVSDPAFNRSFNEIVDLTAVTEHAISDSTLTALAGSESLYDDSVAHIVVASAEFAVQLANKFKTLARGKRRDLFVVRTPAEAYKLLDKRQK
ncbi:MAG TPA: hypothetical protein VJA94_03490 [Candidatus Angelobacter sp.]